MEAYIVRKDGKIAKIELPEGGDDVWKDIGTTYPMSYDDIEGDMLTLGPCDQDASFSPEEDEELSSWIHDYPKRKGPFYIVVTEDTRDGQEWIECAESEKGAISHAMYKWGLLTGFERKRHKIVALALEGDPDDFEDDFYQHVHKYLWDSDEDGREESDDGEEDGSERTDSVTSYKRVRSGGRSLLIYVKEECDEIGATYGDWIEVTIRKAGRRE